ncbi:hypothetical protein FQA47_007402 [Oryzias melastigma]|uniref:Uncharacterized protein n=1 Tax=Oryzias melastigma TaxID=30732 RepID=A0A834CNH5_ORYME|nr:hypothetical protein FQA47_007402 [Oryzias melastigma]
MGCNLCTLQKREEHYKLLYEIAQMLRLMFSLLGPTEEARQTVLHPTGTCGVQRVPPQSHRSPRSDLHSRYLHMSKLDLNHDSIRTDHNFSTILIS